MTDKNKAYFRQLGLNDSCSDLSLRIRKLLTSVILMKVDTIV